MVDAIARRDQIRVLADGMTAANDLGLTNAVPAKIVVHTDSRLKPVHLGNLEISFRPTAASKLFWAGRPAMRIVQALHWLRDTTAHDKEDRPIRHAPAITALAETIQRHRKVYYAQLQRANLSNHIDEWLDWFSDIVLEAQQRTLDRVHFLLAKAKLLDRLRGKINSRQEKALLRMFAEGPDGFKGGVSAAIYRAITDAASATATRDLTELVGLEALRRYGELKHTRYYLNIGGYRLSPRAWRR